MKAMLETQAQTRVAYAAILCPEEFDNYKFWDLVYKSSHQNVEQIEKSARRAGITIQSIRHPDVFFPPIHALLREIARNCSNPKEIFNIVKQCSPNPKSMNWMDELLVANHVEVAPSTNNPDGPDGPNNPPNGPSGPGDSNPPNKPIVDNMPSSFMGKEKSAANAKLSLTINPNQTMPLTPIKASSRTFSFSLYLRIVGGFMATLGVVVVAVAAFALLNAATMGVPGILATGLGLGLGVASLLIGAGLFNVAAKQDKNQAQQPHALNAMGM
jgi:hypothetical protein